MYKMTTMYTYLIYPLDIFGSPNNYVKVKMVHGAMKIFFMKNITQFQYHFHRCQPLRFFRNCYEFRAKITVLRSTVYLLRISDYCRPGTVPHLNIIVII